MRCGSICRQPAAWWLVPLGFRLLLQLHDMVAQDVEQVLPELVVTNADGYKAVDYSKLPLMMLQAIKELKAENDSLRRHNAAMDARLKALEQRMK